VPVLRLRQAFWLAVVGGCKYERYHNVIVFRRFFSFCFLVLWRTIFKGVVIIAAPTVCSICQ
jgi:hypothetical protein